MLLSENAQASLHSYEGWPVHSLLIAYTAVTFYINKLSYGLLHLKLAKYMYINFAIFLTVVFEFSDIKFVNFCIVGHV